MVLYSSLSLETQNTALQFNFKREKFATPNMFEQSHIN